MSWSLSPLFNNNQAVVDANGAPRSGAHLHTYLAETSTPATVYTNHLGSGVGGAAHTNPIILDANGLPPAPIWLTQGATYKFVLAPSTDTTPPVAAILSIDNITGINDVDDVVSTEWTPSSMTPTYVSASSFTVTGDQTTTLHVNRRLKLTESGSSLYGTIIKSTFTSLTTITVLLDSGTLTSDFTGNTFWYGITSAANTSAPFISQDQQCGRLVYVSGTQIKLEPQDGNTIWVNTSAAGWTRRKIQTAAGNYVASANTNAYIDGVSGQTLSTIGATYYVYLFDNAGVLTLDFSTTAPAVDATTGLKIKTGVATRLLVGMVRVTSGSSQFTTPGMVLSWYKRRAIMKSATFTPNQTTASGSLVELEAAAEVKFLAWAEEDIHAEYVGYGSGDTAGEVETTAITLDGISTTIATLSVQTAVATYGANYCLGGYATVTEGHHYVTIAASASAATGTWSAGKLFVLTQG